MIYNSYEMLDMMAYNSGFGWYYVVSQRAWCYVSDGAFLIISKNEIEHAFSMPTTASLDLEKDKRELLPLLDALLFLA